MAFSFSAKACASVLGVHLGVKLSKQHFNIDRNMFHTYSLKIPQINISVVFHSTCDGENSFYHSQERHHTLNFNTSKWIKSSSGV